VGDSESSDWLRMIIDAIERNNARPRKHADFYQWDDRTTMETGIAADFCEELAHSHGVVYALAPHSEIVGKPSDPPDVVLKDASGSLVGLEITELVNPAAITAQVAGRPDYEAVALDLDEHDAVDLLHAMVVRKELAAVNVGPLFADYLLLFHCAEPWLPRRELASAITAYAWPPTRGIRAAYLMFDYEGLGRRPIVKLF
jgi:hypothetical protein